MTVLPDVGAASGGDEIGFGAAPPRRKPHEPQNVLFGWFVWPHCGQMTMPPDAGAAAGGADTATGTGAGAGAATGTGTGAGAAGAGRPAAGG